MTDREKAIVMAYTGIAMLIGDKFDIFHKYVEEIMCRPVFTHEFATCAEEIKEKAKPDFLKLCAEEGEERPHGMWKIDSEYGYIFHCVCSKCNTDVMKYISGSENWWLNSVPNFCPNCGADMREGERN